MKNNTLTSLVCYLLIIPITWWGYHSGVRAETPDNLIPSLFITVPLFVIGTVFFVKSRKIQESKWSMIITICALVAASLCLLFAVGIFVYILLAFSGALG